ncbi:MAG: hypothetical protein WBA22_19305 [Candidatus Methanofastidiosia archaeon]
MGSVAEITFDISLSLLLGHLLTRENTVDQFYPFEKVNFFGNNGWFQKGRHRKENHRN